MSLDEISPLTFSIGNTMKRISVIVSSIIIFHTPVQPVNALGAAIAIFGTFLYSQVHFSLSFHFLIIIFTCLLNLNLVFYVIDTVISSLRIACYCLSLVSILILNYE